MKNKILEYLAQMGTWIGACVVAQILFPKEYAPAMPWIMLYGGVTMMLVSKIEFDKPIKRVQLPAEHLEPVMKAIDRYNHSDQSHWAHHELWELLRSINPEVSTGKWRLHTVNAFEIWLEKLN